MKISILGCGWLGLPLASNLLKQNHLVKGSTTTSSKLSTLEEEGIEPYLITFNPELACNNCSSFWNSDVLVLNIPPGRSRENTMEFHTAQIQSVIDQIRVSTVGRVIFISSTSVYPESPGVVKESDTVAGKAARDSGNALLQAETKLKENKEFDTTIIRFGGLYGYDRHPVKYLAGKQNLDKAKAPVNLIHRDDCIQIIDQVIEEEITGEIFNAVSDGHPPRKMYYRTAAKAMGLEPPTFKKDTEKNYKVVSNRKLKEKLDFHFKHPNPMYFKSDYTEVQ